MRLFITIVWLIVLHVVYTTAQSCVGRPANPSCNGIRDVGNRGRRRQRCNPRDMWYYDADARRCREMLYLGCGGNNNRHCNQAICEQMCRR